MAKKVVKLKEDAKKKKLLQLADAGMVRRGKRYHCHRCNLDINSLNIAHAFRHTYSRAHETSNRFSK